MILTAFSLLSRGRKVTYWHKFGCQHWLFFIVALIVVISCLFYNTLKSQNLLLPYHFIAGFDEKQLLLVVSIIMLGIFLLIINYGSTRIHRLNSLCKNIESLLTTESLGDLVYVLNENIDFFKRECVKEKPETEKTLKKLILSKRLTSYLSEVNYNLYLELLNIYPTNEVFIRKFNEFVFDQLQDEKSYILWETDLLRQSYSPRIPNEDTPLLLNLYSESNLSHKYTLYEQIGTAFDSLIKDSKICSELNISPYNVQTDSVINSSRQSLYIFLFFNLLKNDIRTSQKLRDNISNVRAPWIFTKRFLRPIIEKRNNSVIADNEYKTRFDFLLYESFKTLRDIFELEQIIDMDMFDLDALVESTAFAYYAISDSNKFDNEFIESLLGFCIKIFSELARFNNDLSKKFAQLCTREYETAARSIDISEPSFDTLKLPNAREFIQSAMS